MKANELREKTPDLLREELTASLRELFNLRMQRGTDQLSQRPHLMKKVRRHIARIKTILHEKRSVMVSGQQ